MKLKDVTTIQWLGIVILFNTTLLGGSSQLGDLLLSAVVVKAILAFATLGNGFLGGLVTMFGGASAQAQTVVADPRSQEAIVRAVLAMKGVENLDVNAKASPTLATMAMDKTMDKIAPIPAAVQEVAATASAAASAKAVA